MSTSKSGGGRVVQSIGVLGVGRVGAAVARVARVAGFEVNVAGSGAAEEIALLAEIMIPGSRAMTAAEVAQQSDVVVLAVPLHKYRTVDPATLRGKIVIDAMNYWAPIDGMIDEFENDPRSSSEVILSFFDGARIVKTLNHVGYHELEHDARPGEVSGRRAMAIASDDAEAATIVAEIIDRFGFDAVISESLASGVAFEPATEIFNGSFDAPGLRKALDRSERATSGLQPLA